MAEKQVDLNEHNPELEFQYEALANHHAPEIRLLKLAGQVLGAAPAPDGTVGSTAVWTREIPLPGGRKLTLTKEEPVDRYDDAGSLVTLTEKSVVSPHAPKFIVDLDAYRSLMQGLEVPDEDLALFVNRDAQHDQFDLTGNQPFEQAVRDERGRREQPGGLSGDQFELNALLDEADLADLNDWQLPRAA